MLKPERPLETELFQEATPEMTEDENGTADSGPAAEIRAPYKRRGALAVTVIAGSLLVVFTGIFALEPATPGTPRSGSVAAAALAAPAAFEAPELSAKSAIVWDIKNHEVIFAKNADEVRPLASITKIATILAAADILPERTRIEIEASDLAQDGDSGLLLGENWSFEDLARFTLVSSSNDGAAAIAETANAAVASGYAGQDSPQKTFVGLMNRKADAIGLRRTFFTNVTGLDEAEFNGGYSTAREVALMLEYALVNRPALLEPTADSSFTVSSVSGYKHTAYNTNAALGSIPGIVASKTGYTDLAGGNLAVVIDAGIGHPVAIVVLGSTYDGRFSDVVDLARSVLKYFFGRGEGQGAASLTNL